MKLTKNIEIINNSYRPLHERAVNLAKLLSKLGYSVEWGYYGQHSVMADGEYYLEYYPIPVLTVVDICDIGLDFTQTFIEGKLYTDEAEGFRLEMLKGNKFSVYGANDCLSNLYEDGMTDEELRKAIRDSGEDEFTVSIGFGAEPLTNELIDAVRLFEGMGTHILLPDAGDGEEASGGVSVFDDMDEDTPAFTIAERVRTL